MQRGYFNTSYCSPADDVKIHVKALNREAEVQIRGYRINGTNTKTSNLNNTTLQSPLYSESTLGP